MPRAGARQRVAERFKPGVFDRLKQSEEDKTLKVRKKKATPARALRMPQPMTEIRGQTITQMQVIETPTITMYTHANKREIWNEWMTNTAAFTTGATTCWNGWVADRHATGLTETWVRWQTSDGQHGYARAPGGISMSAAYGDLRPRIEVAESEEQKRLRLEREAARKAQDEAYRAQALAAQKLQEEANARAMALLKSCMTPEQWGMLTHHGYFYVVAKSGRKYRIDKGTHGNVKVVDKDNKVIERLCIQPGGVPVGDSMLAQKLLIETAEDVFRRHANITLNNGQVIWNTERGDLNADKLAPVINIFTKEAVQQSLQPIARVG